MYYFAYGSNMDKSQMEDRGVKFSSRQFALLQNYRLRFNKKASAGNFSYANVENCPNDFVEGILYEVTAEGIEKLDKFEGYPKNYSKLTVDVICQGETVPAIVYIAHPEKIANNLLPKKEYISRLLAGKDLLSPEYYRRLLDVKTLD